MKKVVKALVLASLLIGGSTSTASAASSNLGKETLASNDGWASYGKGTRGGSGADSRHTFTVKNRSEFVRALSEGGNTPKIVYIEGSIDFNVDENNQPATAEHYAKKCGYDFNAYLKAYSPEKWGYDKEVSGPLEDARVCAQKEQKKQVVVNVPSNTSIIGVGKDAKILGGSLNISGVENVIIRNLAFEAPRDFFPQWDPTDGDQGEWNSEYDNIVVTNGAEHVWVDHNTFSDGRYHDEGFGEYFGRKFQQHDGLLDVTNTASYVTASYNVFQDHDKVSLIGSSDSKTSDRGRLKVTLHHNYYKNLTQRLPRVRYGEVHVYNNYYEFAKSTDYSFQYALGVGTESKIYAQNNYFSFDYNVPLGNIIKDWKGTSIYEEGSYVKSPAGERQVDLLQETNKENSTVLDESVGWKPSLYKKIHPTQSVPGTVKAQAGAGKL